MSKTTALHVLHAFSTFLGHPLHDYNVKPSFFGGLWTYDEEFCFPFLTWIKTLRIQLQAWI